MTDTAAKERAAAGLALDRPGPAIPHLDPYPVPPPRRSTGAALALMLTALTHLALVAIEAPQPGAAAGLAIAVAVADAALGAGALRGWRRHTVQGAVAVNAAFFGAWLVLRAVVPASPPGRQPAVAGVVAVLAILAVLAVTVMLARELGPPRPRSARGARMSGSWPRCGRWCSQPAPLASSTVPGDFAALETEEVPPAHGDFTPMSIQRLADHLADVADADRRARSASAHAELYLLAAGRWSGPPARATSPTSSSSPVSSERSVLRRPLTDQP